jgi:hydroxyacylglutathione hydrolase
MFELAPHVYQLKLFPQHIVNCYLLGDVLVDAGTGFGVKGILKQLADKKVSAHALTHVHIDHAGGSYAVCSTLDIPLYCGEKDIQAMETGDMSIQSQPNPLTKRQKITSHPAQALHEGDEIGGFKVLETPGHTLGHLSFWRESDKVLICGDVILNISFLTLRPHLRQPITKFSMDMPLNRESAHRLAALKPRLVCFGHGKPEDGAKVVDFVRRLPRP